MKKEDKSMKVELLDIKPVDKKTELALEELFPVSHIKGHTHSGTFWREGECWHLDIDVPF